MSILHIVGVVKSFKVTWRMHVFCFTITYLVCLLVQEYIVNLFIWILEKGWIITITGNAYVELALFIVLLPLTVISLISICVGGSIGAAIFPFNTLGSVGDLIMAFYLCKSNENSYIEDKSYGFDVIT